MRFTYAEAMIGALSAVTTKLHFNIFVLKLPIRPPALVAKQAGSLAAMFDNRLGLGVGTSPWPEDYEIMGVPFARRGKRIDGFTLDGVRRLEDKGVTDVMVGFRIPYIIGPDTEPLDSKIRNLEKFAEKVIAKA